MARYKDQRVGILVDISNMYHSSKNLYKKRVNYKEVMREAVGDRKLIRATAYAIRTESEEETPFFEALAQVGFEVKMKDLQIFAGGAKKADWDVGIAVDAIKMASKVDVVVLLSGDGDYVSLVEYIQNTYGCRVEVVAFAESASAKLIDAADDFTNISEEKRRFLIS